jgi:hypothetical protein
VKFVAVETIILMFLPCRDVLHSWIEASSSGLSINTWKTVHQTIARLIFLLLMLWVKCLIDAIFISGTLLFNAMRVFLSIHQKFILLTAAVYFLNFVLLHLLCLGAS